MTRKDKQGVSLFVGVMVVFVVLTLLSLRLKASADAYDPETLCRLDGEYPTVKMLIDKTDPWSREEQKRLAALIRRVKEQLAGGERLAIYVLDETGTYSPVPVFDLCNPGQGSQANPLYENPKRIQERFENQFQEPLERILADLLRPGVAPRSPILESVLALKGAAGRPERLIIVSDMLQNSELFTFYGKSSLPEPGQVCRIPSLYEQVEVHAVSRSSLRSSQRQRNFWDDCLGRVAQGRPVWKTMGTERSMTPAKTQRGSRL